MGHVHCRVSSAAVKESRRESTLSMQQLHARPLTDRQKASSIELSSSQRCSSLESLSTHTSEAIGGAGTTTLSHYNPQGYDAASSIAQHTLGAHGSSELTRDRGTFVLSHYTEYYVSDRTVVLDYRSSKPSVSRRLSHPPGIADVPSSTGYSASPASAGGPPPLEHLPNYCTLNDGLNSSSNNSARSLPPPLLCPSGSNSDSVPPATDPLESVPLPLQLIPLSVAPSLLKLEPLSSPSTHLDSDVVLWKPPCSSDVSPHAVAVVPTVSGTSTSIRVSCSPPPLAHPPHVLASLHSNTSAPSAVSATDSSVTLFQPHSSIMLYGPPQGTYVN